MVAITQCSVLYRKICRRQRLILLAVSTHVTHCLPHPSSTGLGLGPLLQMSLYINTTLIPTAFLLSSAVFVSFTLAALYARRAQFLFLGGILGSALSLMLLLSLANIFFRSSLIFQVRGLSVLA